MPSKEEKALWKTNLKLLKSKDVDQKFNGLDFAASNYVFFHSFSGVAATILSMCTKLKNKELLYKTVSTLHTLVLDSQDDSVLNMKALVALHQIPSTTTEEAKSVAKSSYSAISSEKHIFTILSKILDCKIKKDEKKSMVGVRLSLLQVFEVFLQEYTATETDSGAITTLKTSCLKLLKLNLEADTEVKKTNTALIKALWQLVATGKEIPDCQTLSMFNESHIEILFSELVVDSNCNPDILNLLSKLFSNGLFNETSNAVSKNRIKVLTTLYKAVASESNSILSRAQIQSLIKILTHRILAEAHSVTNAAGDTSILPDAADSEAAEASTEGGAESDHKEKSTEGESVTVTSDALSPEVVFGVLESHLALLKNFELGNEDETIPRSSLQEIVLDSFIRLLEIYLFKSSNESKARCESVSASTYCMEFLQNLILKEDFLKILFQILSQTKIIADDSTLEANEEVKDSLSENSFSLIEKRKLQTLEILLHIVISNVLKEKETEATASSEILTVIGKSVTDILSTTEVETSCVIVSATASVASLVLHTASPSLITEDFSILLVPSLVRLIYDTHTTTSATIFAIKCVSRLAVVSPKVNQLIVTEVSSSENLSVISALLSYLKSGDPTETNDRKFYVSDPLVHYIPSLSSNLASQSVDSEATKRKLGIEVNFESLCATALHDIVKSYKVDNEEDSNTGTGAQASDSKKKNSKTATASTIPSYKTSFDLLLSKALEIFDVLSNSHNGDVITTLLLIISSWTQFSLVDLIKTVLKDIDEAEELASELPIRDSSCIKPTSHYNTVLSPFVLLLNNANNAPIATDIITALVTCSDIYNNDISHGNIFTQCAIQVQSILPILINHLAVATCAKNTSDNNTLSLAMHCINLGSEKQREYNEKQEEAGTDGKDGNLESAVINASIQDAWAAYVLSPSDSDHNPLELSLRLSVEPVAIALLTTGRIPINSTFSTMNEFNKEESDSISVLMLALLVDASDSIIDTLLSLNATCNKSSILEYISPKKHYTALRAALCSNSGPARFKTIVSKLRQTTNSCDMINISDCDGNYPLHWLLMLGNQEPISISYRGKSYHQSDNNAAVSDTILSLVQYVLDDHEVDTNVCNNNGETPLHLATKKSLQDKVALLLLSSRDTNPNIMDNQSKLPQSKDGTELSKALRATSLKYPVPRRGVHVDKMRHLDYNQQRLVKVNDIIESYGINKTPEIIKTQLLLNAA